jgi:hypothetical protein
VRVTWQVLSPKAEYSTVARTTAHTTARLTITDRPRAFPRSGMLDAQRQVDLFQVSDIVANRKRYIKLRNGERMHFLFGLFWKKNDGLSSKFAL